MPLSIAEHDQERPGHAGGALDQQQGDRDGQQALVRAQQPNAAAPGCRRRSRATRRRVAGLGDRYGRRRRRGARPRQAPMSVPRCWGTPVPSRRRRAGRGQHVRYAGTVASSSECVPVAAIAPSRSSATRSARAIVDGRCTTSSAVMPSQHPAERRLDQRLGVHVERRERVVEHQHPRPAEHRAGQRQPLALPAGERQPLLADPGVQAPRQVVDEVGLGHRERLAHLVVGRRCRARASGSPGRTSRTASAPRTRCRPPGAASRA